MALRRHLSDALKLSNVVNSIGCERSAFLSTTRVQKKINQHEQIRNISPHQLSLSSLKKNHHQIPITRIDQTLMSLSLNSDVLKTSESETVSCEYQCPSRLTHRFSEMVILDKQTNKSDYHLPLANTINSSLIDPQWRNQTSEIKDPASSQHTPAKEAKEIMRIRHKKMKKHKLKKLRRRMYFLWRKQKLTRKAKRDGIYWNQIEEIKKEGEDFDAESFVKSQLEKARRGGYYVNVFESKV